MLEYNIFYTLNKGYFKLILCGDYHNRTNSSAFVALIGQAILIIALFLKAGIHKNRIIYLGLFILFLSFFLMSKNLLSSKFDRFSFLSGIPFLTTATLLFIHLRIRNNLKK